MPTKRSLNKMEFKAHMSIHDSTEVKDEEIQEERHYTRDRFGKKHALPDKAGAPRVKK